MDAKNLTTSKSCGSAPRGLGIPERVYEPNIQSNPFEWMGIWTPQGWRVHRKRFGRAVRKTVYLSGDGETTFFPGALRDPDTGKVEWQDDLHLEDDPYTDAGIYPCDPRVEYPAGQPRWQVSHTLMVAPVADHNLYTHEYTWDLTHGHLYTHFRKHVAIEKARTDSIDGRTVRIKHTPISSTIEGNVHYPLNNSAVRGVWADQEKSGPNYYTRRVTRLVAMLNGVYLVTPDTPVVQCHGLYPVSPSDPIDSLFDPITGLCRDAEQLASCCGIAIDLPKLGMISMHDSLNKIPSKLYGAEVWTLGELGREITSSDVRQVQQRVGEVYRHGLCGYAYEATDNQSHEGYRGYGAPYDLDGDGRIDDADVALLAANVGRSVRYNLYQDAYFGGDWLSTSLCMNPEHTPGEPIIADYTYGGGYDAQSGVIHLLDTPGPDQTVWVEYHYDAPAEPGENNIAIHLYQELD